MRTTLASAWALSFASLFGALGCESSIVCEGAACEDGSGGTDPTTTTGGAGVRGVDPPLVGGAGGGGASPLCGNGFVEAGEECDGADLPREPPCSTAICTAQCVVDASSCEPSCGDGLVEGEELCDGAQLAGATCQELVPGSPGGVLACAVDCTYDVSQCTIPSNCGNGVIDVGEACDGMNFGGLTCESLGFAGGALACNASCNIVANGCSSCGNGIVNAGEQCDGVDFQGVTCGSLGYPQGTLTCTPSCSFDVSGCSP